MANNKFLQILRNFDSTTRAQAIAKLEAAANSETLWHAGTPIVAFYVPEQKTFAYRSSSKTYGTDTTSNYKALLGVMGQTRGAIEIFDIQTSVEHLLGGATQITTTSANSVGAGETWDFTSLGGIQVVIEQLDEVITASLGDLDDLSDRITAITGESGDTYDNTTTTIQGATMTYVNDASSLKNAVEQLDVALASLAGTVSGNSISNADHSIVVTPTTSGGVTDTDVHVNIDHANEHVIELGNNGLYTDIKIAKVIASGTPQDDEIVGTLGTNVKEAFALKATDGTMLGNQINIYKDSSLKEVYLGASTDTIDASTGVITKNTVTDPQSMNFAYQLADGTYSLTKIDVSKFLTESEFGDGLSVSNAGVVSVNAGDGLVINSTSKAVDVNPGNGIQISSDAVAAKIGNGLDFGSNNEIVVKIDDSDDTNDYLTVGSDGVKLDGDAIDQAIADAAADVEVTAAGDSVYIAAAQDSSDKKKINVTGTYGAFNTPTAANNTLSATTNGIAKAEDVATAVNTVVGNLDGSATATAASGDVYTVLTGVSQADGVISKASEVTLAAVAKTGDAEDVTYDNTTSGMTATDVQAAIDELEGRLDTLGTDALEGVTSANAGIAVGTKTNHSQQLTLTLDTVSTSASSPQTITGASNVAQITANGLYVSNVWDCGEYTINETPTEPVTP